MHAIRNARPDEAEFLGLLWRERHFRLRVRRFGKRLREP